MREIVNRLQENRQIERAKSILEANGYTVRRPESMSKAYAQLKDEDPKKVEYVKKAYNAYVHEYGKYGTDEEETMHPEEVKRDWMLGAIEDDMMTEEEFERLFKLIDDADDSSMAYA